MTIVATLFTTSFSATLCWRHFAISDENTVYFILKKSEKVLPFIDLLLNQEISSYYGKAKCQSNKQYKCSEDIKDVVQSDLRFPSSPAIMAGSSMCLTILFFQNHLKQSNFICCKLSFLHRGILVIPHSYRSLIITRNASDVNERDNLPTIANHSKHANAALSFTLDSWGLRDARFLHLLW